MERMIERTVRSANALKLPQGVRAESPWDRAAKIHSKMLRKAARKVVKATADKDKFCTQTKWTIPRRTFIQAALSLSDIEKLSRWLEANDHIYVGKGSDGLALILNVTKSTKWAERRNAKVDKAKNPTPVDPQNGILLNEDNSKTENSTLKEPQESP